MKSTSIPLRRAFLILIFGCFFSVFSQAKSDYLLPTSLINLYLQLHAPITQDFSPLLMIQLNNTDVSTKENSQRIEVASSISIILPNQSAIKGKVRFSSSFRYDNMSKKVLLMQPQIESLDIDNLYSSSEKLLMQLNPILTQLLNGITVYEFTSKNAMIPKAPSHLKVEAEGIRFYFD
ncbi:DUF1439 domain-containing protein [Polynucleobacter kasalickyi]|uniref:DUF1439 domain-containing protein n=1 Tax=Polynucleobacter kasalickyi TaxID=1938817 RepID=A0A1W2AWR5_9BURK|nr:DUF1439 domain-containing protein [Polynucleobacter kasalickyi]SMC64638.1 Protein of unknown function [Polynucleobacter kasalickyi]